MEPHRLFRLLTTVPYPVKAIDYRFSFAPDAALLVKAITRREMFVTSDSSMHLCKSIRNSRANLELTQRCLLTVDGEPAFGSVDEMLGLTEMELIPLIGKVTATLSEISPIYGEATHDTWAAALEAGAEHISNFFDACLMCDSRINQYYGMPVNQLTDGHMMAHAAACKVIREFREKQKQAS